MTKLKISKVSSKSEAQVSAIYNFNVQAFADSQDFAWTKDNIKNEMKSGWELFSVDVDEEIVCALFLKKGPNTLFTKNTPVKINFQGNGFSHEIKNFYEEYAKDQNLKKIINYCPKDNFRMISLNEGHNYKKTGNTVEGNTNIIEWIKELE